MVSKAIELWCEGNKCKYEEEKQMGLPRGRSREEAMADISEDVMRSCPQMWLLSSLSSDEEVYEQNMEVREAVSFKTSGSDSKVDVFLFAPHGFLLYSMGFKRQNCPPLVTLLSPFFMCCVE